MRAPLELLQHLVGRSCRRATVRWPGNCSHCSVIVWTVSNWSSPALSLLSRYLDFPVATKIKSPNIALHVPSDRAQASKHSTPIGHKPCRVDVHNRSVDPLVQKKCECNDSPMVMDLAYVRTHSGPQPCIDRNDNSARPRARHIRSHLNKRTKNAHVKLAAGGGRLPSRTPPGARQWCWPPRAWRGSSVSQRAAASSPEAKRSPPAFRVCNRKLIPGIMSQYRREAQIAH